MKKTNKPLTLRQKIYQIIFEADTFYGKLFDEILLLLIVMSIAAVMLESISAVRARYFTLLWGMEWAFTLLFTIEYLFRIYSSPNPRRYIFSFFGIVDLLAIIPTYIAIFIPTAQALVVIRAIRLLRIFRVFKLYRFISAGNMLLYAITKSMRKIFIFMLFLLIIVTMLGSIMYVVEGGKNGFFSIPLSIYWAVITLTTVGYGDIVPVTALGKFIATFIMLLGYSIIAIPTGIVSIEMSRAFGKKEYISRTCNYCNEEQHEPDAHFCRICGKKIE